MRELLAFLFAAALLSSPLRAKPPAGFPAAARGLILDAAVNGVAIVAVGERGAIIRSADSGDSWETLTSPTHADLTALVFATPSHGWAVGHGGIILHTLDGGETWTEQFQTENRDTVFLDVAAIDQQRAIAVGAFGACWITLDGGRNWQPQKLPVEDNHLNRVTLNTDGDFYIAGERGTLLQITSLKRNAALLHLPSPSSYYGILPLSKTTLLAHGLGGRIYRSEDAGASWKNISSPLSALFATSIRLKSGTIILAGQARAFVISLDEGRTFQVWNPPHTTAIAELIEAPNGKLLAFGEGGVARLNPPPAPENPPVVDKVAPPATYLPPLPRPL